MRKLFIIIFLLLVSCQSNQVLKKDSSKDNVKSKEIKMKVTSGNLGIKKKK